MSRPTLLFAHGWAFDSSVWDALRARLADWPQATFDAGYFGAASGMPAIAGPVVAIGHSHGVMRLLAHFGVAGDARDASPQRLAALISLNGFSRFGATPDFPAGTPAKLVDRMLSRYAQAPHAVLNAFRERCGAAALVDVPTLAPALGDDLRALRDDDRRRALTALAVPLLVLAGHDDPIVPPALTQAAFDGHPHARVAWHEGAGHLLPIHDAAWCADRIAEFLAPCDAVSAAAGSSSSPPAA